ncbi:MAG: hypothetical protein GEU99_21525 [Luteitalea sp.]|nr:hypothetical protein [Luteitalea sp.]
MEHDEHGGNYREDRARTGQRAGRTPRDDAEERDHPDGRYRLDEIAAEHVPIQLAHAVLDSRGGIFRAFALRVQRTVLPCVFASLDGHLTPPRIGS